MNGLIYGNTVGVRHATENDSTSNSSGAYPAGLSLHAIFACAAASAFSEGSPYDEAFRRWHFDYRKSGQELDHSLLIWLAIEGTGPFQSNSAMGALASLPLPWMATSMSQANRESLKVILGAFNGEESIYWTQIAVNVGWLLRQRRSQKEALEFLRVNDCKLPELSDRTVQNKAAPPAGEVIPYALQAVLSASDFDGAIENALSFGFNPVEIATATGFYAELLHGMPKHYHQFVITLPDQEVRKAVKCANGGEMIQPDAERSSFWKRVLRSGKALDA